MGTAEKRLLSGLLDLDIEQIINSDVEEKYKYLNYNVTICSPYGDYPIGMLLKQIEWTRNFNDNAMEDIRILFTMDGSVYREYVHDYKDQLEVVIEKRIGKQIVDTNRYKLFLLTNTAEYYQDSFNYMTEEQLKAMVPVELEGQCVSRESYALNDIMIEGIYKNTTLDKVILSELDSTKTKMEYQDGTPELQYDIVKIDNPNTYGHINIPTGTKILALPRYLQNNDSYGIYNCGLGRFVQKYKSKTCVFVYPLFDPKQFDEKEDRLMIFHTSHQRAGHYGNTYMLDGKILKIIPHYNYGFNDPKQDKLLEGDSVTYGLPDNVYRSYRKIDNGVTLSSKNTNNLVTHTAKSMNDGSVRTKYAGIVSNAYKHRSEVMDGMMAKYQLTWYNANIDLIYPGMPCMFITEHSKNGLLKLRGQVQAVTQTYLGDKKEQHAQITIAVMSPSVLMDNEQYQDTNVKSSIGRSNQQ